MDLTFAQAHQLARYFLGPHFTVGNHPPNYAVFDRTRVISISNQSYEQALQRAGAWPDPYDYPPPPRFAANACNVMRGGENMAVARTHSFAKQIAQSLNATTLPRKR